MAVEGTLDLFKLPEILQLISQQKKTGILTVQGQQDIVAISFLTGRIVAADALNQTLEEGLSQILLKEGIISAPDLGRAASEHQASGGRLVDLLVERRYIERSQLLEALRLQTYRLLEQLLRWSQGDFKFYSGDEVSFEDGFVPISVEELLIKAAPAIQAAQAAAPAPPRPVATVAPTAAAPPARPSASPPAETIPFPGPRSAATGPRPVAPPKPALKPATKPATPPMSPTPLMPLMPPGPQGVSPAVAPLAEPLVPPADADGPFRQMRVETRAASPRSLGWVGRTLAALLTALVVASLLLLPDSLMIPFPWQERERDVLVRDQRAALYLKIDRAAKTWFLLKGSFPDRLQDLVAAGLLSSADLEDPEGRPLRYIASEESYTLQPLQRAKPLAGAEETEAITGNFLLDPEFLNVSPETTAAPLVLLD
jgi:hypothetical protein